MNRENCIGLQSFQQVLHNFLRSFMFPAKVSMEIDNLNFLTKISAVVCFGLLQQTPHVNLFPGDLCMRKVESVVGVTHAYEAVWSEVL